MSSVFEAGNIIFHQTETAAYPTTWRLSPVTSPLVP